MDEERGLAVAEPDSEMDVRSLLSAEGDAMEPTDYEREERIWKHIANFAKGMFFGK